MANDLLVRILGDSRSLERSFAQSEAASKSFGRSMDTTTRKVDKGLKSFKGFATGTAVGFGGAVAFNELQQQVSAAIDVASNLNEQIARTEVVFGSSAESVEAWSRTTAKGIGIASDQALEAAGTFGAMFEQAGRTTGDAARLSEAVVTLASDLASFNNANIDDTLTALRSGLSGEIEPLRRFQVFLTEAAVSARAMADSNKTNVKELTQGEKIMARWNIILEQTGKQQGDFARTSEGLANQQRILAANVRDLQAKVGGALLPAMRSLTGVLNDATTGALALADALGKVGSIKIPTIVIPFTTKEIGGGTFGGTAAKVAGVGVLGAISPAALATAAIVKLIKSFQDEPPPDTSAAAKALDAKFDTFLESLEKDINGSVERANTALKAFGQKGFKPLEVNELGESLQRAFDASLDALDLKFDQAQFRGNQTEALAALAEEEAAIRKRMETHGRTTDLLRQLLQVEQQRQAIFDANKEAARRAADAAKDAAKAQADRAREAAKAARAAAKAAEQERQFRALGLSASGDEIVPGAKNLATRVQGALRRIGTGELDVGSKVVDRLKLARTLLKKEGANLTQDTRRVINDLLKTLNQGAKDVTQETKRIQISDDILKALGLNKDLATANIQKFSPPLTRSGGTFRPVTSTPADKGVNINGPITVVADNPDAFLRELQKKAGRSAATARGRHAGRSLGLG